MGRGKERREGGVGEEGRRKERREKGEDERERRGVGEKMGNGGTKRGEENGEEEGKVEKREGEMCGRKRTLHFLGWLGVVQGTHHLYICCMF